MCLAMHNVMAGKQSDDVRGSKQSNANLELSVVK